MNNEPDTSDHINIIACYFVIMAKRVTIMIDDDLDKKLRVRQAKMIVQEHTSYSFSKVINEIIRKVLK